MQRFLNFSGIRVMVAHGSKPVANLYQSVLRSFGVRDVEIAVTVGEARRIFDIGAIDLAIVDSSIGRDLAGPMVTHVRQSRTETQREIPILMTQGHTRHSDTVRYRDHGANMIMSTPFSVEAIYDRLAWIAHKPRPFVSAETYCGPCRRITTDPMAARMGRRREDQSGKAEEAHAIV